MTKIKRILLHKSMFRSLVSSFLHCPKIEKSKNSFPRTISSFHLYVGLRLATAAQATVAGGKSRVRGQIHGSRLRL